MFSAENRAPIPLMVDITTSSSVMVCFIDMQETVQGGFYTHTHTHRSHSFLPLSFGPSPFEANRPAVSELHDFTAYLGTLRCIMFKCCDTQKQENSHLSASRRQRMRASDKMLLSVFSAFIFNVKSGDVRFQWKGSSDWKNERRVASRPHRTIGCVNLPGLSGIGAIWLFSFLQGMMTKYLFLIRYPPAPPLPSTSHDTNLWRPFVAQMSPFPLPPSSFSYWPGQD